MLVAAWMTYFFTTQFTTFEGQVMQRYAKICQVKRPKKLWKIHLLPENQPFAKLCQVMQRYAKLRFRGRINRKRIHCNLSLLQVVLAHPPNRLSFSKVRPLMLFSRRI